MHINLDRCIWDCAPSFNWKLRPKVKCDFKLTTRKKNYQIKVDLFVNIWVTQAYLAKDSHFLYL